MMFGIGPTNYDSLARKLLIRPVETTYLPVLISMPNKAARELHKGTEEGIKTAANHCTVFFNSIRQNEESNCLFIKLSGAPALASALLQFVGANPGKYDQDKLDWIESILRGEKHERCATHGT